MSSFTISARGKAASLPIDVFLAEFFPHIALTDIESVFGFIEPCKLYGGRTYSGPQLSDADVVWLAERGIGIRLPLTSLYYTTELYNEALPILFKYHNKLNTIICTSDQLALRIHQDFPYYTIEASVIKDIDSQEKITAALNIYDTVILPTRFGTELELLATLEPKDRLRLFTAGGCGYNCPAKVCYSYVSKINAGKETTDIACSKKKIARPMLRMVEFDIKALERLGYTKFKAVRGLGKNTFTY